MNAKDDGPRSAGFSARASREGGVSHDGARAFSPRGSTKYETVPHVVDQAPENVAAHHIPPQSGLALQLEAGQTLRIIDREGGQVSDIVAFAADDTAEAISNGRTLDYNGTMRLTTGHILYSNRARPMFTITEDTVGVHDFTLAPCSQEMFELLHGVTDPHPSCFGNLVEALAPYLISPDAIPTAFNAFMNVRIDPNGDITVLPPTCRPGDHIDLRAEIDLLVGITACSAEQSNGGAFKPIDVRILD